MLSRAYFLTLSLFLLACGIEPEKHPHEEDAQISDMSDMEIHDQATEDLFDLPDNDFDGGEPPEGPVEIHPGVGIDTFTPVLQGVPVRWQMGFQGGYHLWVALKVDGEFLTGKTQAELNMIQHRYTIRRADSTLLASLSTEGGFTTDENGDLAFVGGWAVFEPFAFTPFEMDGEELFYKVDITLPGNESYTSHVWVKSECCDY